MKYLSCVLLALPLALVVGPAAHAQMAETPYYPLKIGTKWTYKIGETHFTLTVTKHEEVESEGGKKQLCARIEMAGNDGKVQAVEHVAVKEDGVYRYMFENKKAEPPVKFLKLPPMKGDTWDVTAKIGAEKLSGTFKIGEVADDVKVPAGTYKKENVVTSGSDNLDANGQKISFTYYFAKDVGMIKQTIKIMTQEVIIELEKYEPGTGKVS
jgi:hypothetical protein